MVASGVWSFGEWSFGDWSFGEWSLGEWTVFLRVLIDPADFALSQIPLRLWQAGQRFAKTRPLIYRELRMFSSPQNTIE
jgi:hypothetical protein